MNELMRKLKMADVICRKANTHFIKIDEIEQEKENIKAKNKNLLRNVIIACVVAILLLDTMGGVVGLAIEIAIIAGGIFFYKQKKRTTTDTINSLDNLINAESLKATEIFDNNINDLSFLHSDYWYPMATEYLIKMIATNRASELNQALSLYDAYLHRMRIEEANNQMLQQQQAQTEHLKSIRRTSKVNAAANVASAVSNLSRHF